MNTNARYGLIGEKLSHSFSKVIHERLCDYKYDLIEIKRESLADFMTNREFAAINVTIPYKQAVIPYLDELSDRAKKIGAVNTIINKNGRLIGYNTDYAGVLYMLKGLSTNGEASIAGKTVLILGSGGTRKTLKAVLSDLGAKEILTASRSPLNPHFNNDGILSYDEAKTRTDIQIICNASPVGMYPDNEASPIDLSAFPALCGVVDVIYNPLKTKLLQQADTLSIKNVSGLPMLVAQAKYAAELFCSTKIPDERIAEITASIKKEQINFVLIGMPASGKSRMGRALAKQFSRPFVDIDAEIEKHTGKSIPDIFASAGEKAFRLYEEELTACFSREHGLVIATGGGAVLSEKNISALHQNGVLCFINRPLEQLLCNNNIGGKRPLSTSAETIERLFSTRIPLYLAASDYTILNDGDFSVAFEKAVAAFSNTDND